MRSTILANSDISSESDIIIPDVTQQQMIVMETDEIYFPVFISSSGRRLYVSLISQRFKEKSDESRGW